MKRILTCCVLALLAPVATLAKSPKSITLDEAIASAIETNRELAAAEQKWRASQSVIQGTRSLPDPMIGADVERAGSTSFSGWNDIEYMVQQDIPGLGKRGARKDVAVLEAEAEGYRFLEVARATRNRAAQAYWDLWLAERSAEVMAKSRDLMSVMADSALAHYESGTAKQSEVLRLQVERSRMSNQVVTMEREIGVAQAKLNSILNAPSDTPRRTQVKPPLPEFNVDLEEMQEHARNFCFILRSSLREIDAKKAALRVAKIERRPDLQFRVEARQFEESGNIDEYDTGVFMSFPWLWGGKYKSMVNEARADLNVAQADYEAEVNKTMMEIQQLHTMAESALRTLRLNQDDLLPRTQSLVESVKSSYQTGQVPLLEFLDAQKADLDLQLETYRTTAEFAKNYAMLMNIAEPWGDYELSTGLVTRDMKEE